MRTPLLYVVALSWFSAVTSALAAFHVMQIEQIIGGLGGDATAQAVQLRLRGAGQTVLGNGRLMIWNAAGTSESVLCDFTTSVANGALGDNILITSPQFDTFMNGKLSTLGGNAYSNLTSDFKLTLANPIPLSGGKITFESNAGFIYWSFAYGNYAGTNLATSNDTTNDDDGDFGAKVASALMSNGTAAILTIANSAKSTTNAANYSFTPGAATVRNNARNSYVVVPEPGVAAMLIAGGLGLGRLGFARRRR